MNRILMLLLVALFSAPAVNAQLANDDFENWYADSTGQLRLQSWEHIGPGDHPIASTPFYGTWPESSAKHGAKALKISRWYNYTWDAVRQAAPINLRPSALSGYYKYTDNNLIKANVRSKDTAIITILLTKWNAILHERDTIGSGYKELIESLPYSHFTCPFNYVASSAIPDSIIVRFMPTKFKLGSGSPVCADSGLCSFLTLDYLMLEQNTGVTSFHHQQPMVFPNPPTNILTVDLRETGISDITITDAVGKTLYVARNVSGIASVDVRNWSEGLYYLRINGKEYLSTFKFNKHFDFK